MRLSDEVFPIEHTYFTHRLSIAYGPKVVADYLRGAISVVPPQGSVAADSGSGSTEGLAALILGRVVMHRSQLNATSLVRCLAGWAGEDRLVTEREGDLRSGEVYRLETLLQLAVEHAMERPAIRARTDTDTRFVQVANDALYMVSQAWKRGDATVEVTLDRVKEHLVRRMRHDTSTAITLSPDDLAAFHAAVQAVADLVCDFGNMRTEVETAGRIALDDRPLMTVFDPPIGPLLDSLGQGSYRIRWDPFFFFIYTA